MSEQGNSTFKKVLWVVAAIAIGVIAFVASDYIATYSRGGLATIEPKTTTDTTTDNTGQANSDELTTSRPWNYAFTMANGETGIFTVNFSAHVDQNKLVMDEMELVGLSSNVMQLMLEYEKDPGQGVQAVKENLGIELKTTTTASQIGTSVGSAGGEQLTGSQLEGMNYLGSADNLTTETDQLSAGQQQELTSIIGNGLEAMSAKDAGLLSDMGFLGNSDAVNENALSLAQVGYAAGVDMLGVGYGLENAGNINMVELSSTFEYTLGSEGGFLVGSDTGMPLTDMQTAAFWGDMASFGLWDDDGGIVTPFDPSLPCSGFWGRLWDAIKGITKIIVGIALILASLDTWNLGNLIEGILLVLSGIGDLYNAFKGLGGGSGGGDDGGSGPGPTGPWPPGGFPGYPGEQPGDHPTSLSPVITIA